MITKATKEWHGKPLYKVLTNGESQNGGYMTWSLPKGTRAGKWHKHEGVVRRCQSGFHLTTEPYRWVGINSTLYLAEVKGTVDDKEGDDKIAVSECRLLQETPHEQWWLDAKEFIDSIKNVPWFKNSETVPKSKKVKMFDSHAAAGAAWDAARDAAADAARDAARGAAWGAARDAAADAARDAAADAAAGAAWDAARDAAAGAAWDAALFTCAIHISSGLNIPKKHLDHAKLRWAVWEAGYGVVGDVDGILYCYKGKP